MRARSPRPLIAAGVLALVFTPSAPVLAYDVEVSASTAAQLYAVSPAWPGTILRRRYLQTLGLDVYRLGQGDVEPDDPEVFFKLRMRLDTDFGIPAALTSYSPVSNSFIPGVTPSPVDLMYGYFEGRNFGRGLVGFRVGRQYIADSLGWWSFDGGLVRFTSPWYFALEAYGGLEQRGGLPLSLPRFEQGGVWRGNRKGYENEIYPQFQHADLAPAWGVAIESAGLSQVHARADYRKVQNTGVSVVGALPDPVTGTYPTIDETRTSSERVGFAADASVRGIGGVSGGVVYDLYDALFASFHGAADADLTDWLTVGADYDFLRPTFDADSIFNFFAHSPMRTIRGRAALLRAVDASLSAGIRRYYTDGDPWAWTGTTAPAASAAQDDPVAEVQIRIPRALRSRLDGGVRGMIEGGDHGYLRGVDMDLQIPLLAGRYSVQGRISEYEFSDALRPDRGGTSTGLVLGGSMRPSRGARATAELEQDTSSLVGRRYRIVGLLDLEVGP